MSFLGRILDTGKVMWPPRATASTEDMDIVRVVIPFGYRSLFVWLTVWIFVTVIQIHISKIIRTEMRVWVPCHAVTFVFFFDAAVVSLTFLLGHCQRCTRPRV